MRLQFHRSRVRGPGASNAPQCPTKAKGIVPGRVSRKQIWTETNIYEVLKHKHILQRFMGWEPGSLGGCEEAMWKMMGVTGGPGPRRESKSPRASYHGNELQWKSESDLSSCSGVLLHREHASSHTCFCNGALCHHVMHLPASHRNNHCHAGGTVTLPRCALSSQIFFISYFASSILTS